MLAEFFVSEIQCLRFQGIRMKTVFELGPQKWHQQVALGCRQEIAALCFMIIVY
jgi:hypothetical protein